MRSAVPEATKAWSAARQTAQEAAVTAPHTAFPELKRVPPPTGCCNIQLKHCSHSEEGGTITVCIDGDGRGTIDITGPDIRAADALFGIGWFDRSQAPCIGGEHGCWPCCRAPAFGSPPHRRGARIRHRCVGACPRISPASAGSPTVVRATPRAVPDHPRIGGEHIGIVVLGVLLSGSPPHRRGTHLLQHRLLCR
jgi:hypothetical protein